jgi:hypothetical protein
MPAAASWRSHAALIQPACECLDCRRARILECSNDWKQTALRWPHPHVGYLFSVDYCFDFYSLVTQADGTLVAPPLVTACGRSDDGAYPASGPSGGGLLRRGSLLTQWSPPVRLAR